MLQGGRKRKPERENIVNEEVVQAIKTMSKQAQKRFKQIELRKEKEAKRSSYYHLLTKHELSAEHQELMTSTKDIGQSHSIKATLKKLLKRFRAGLTLTTEEGKLLFPDGMDATAVKSMDSICRDQEFCIASQSQTPAPTVASVKPNDAGSFHSDGEELSGVIFDINSLLQGTEARDDESRASVKKPKKKRKKQDGCDTIDSEVTEGNKQSETLSIITVQNIQEKGTSVSSNVSVGKNLWSQLQNFNSRISSVSMTPAPTGSTTRDISTTDTSCPCPQKSTDNKDSNEYPLVKIYTPVSIPLPAMESIQPLTAGQTQIANLRRQGPQESDTSRRERQGEGLVSKGAGSLGDAIPWLLRPVTVARSSDIQVGCVPSL